MVLSLALIAMLGPKDAAVRKEISADYTAMSRQFSKGDIDALAKFLTDDYVVDDGKKVTAKPEIVRSFKGLASIFKSPTWKRDIVKLSVTGDKAVATVSGDFQAQMPDPDPKKSAHRFRLRATTVDTWVKTSAGYRMQKSRVTRNRVEVDGKLQPGSM